MCDDGNNLSGDGCSSSCIIEHGFKCLNGTAHNPDNCTEICGDGFNIGILSCDDGNVLDGDGCNS